AKLPLASGEIDGRSKAIPKLRRRKTYRLLPSYCGILRDRHELAFVVLHRRYTKRRLSRERRRAELSSIVAVMSSFATAISSN
ncbi:hypothetical protein PFISCL1PPCAC_27811, partial [Pristionchus fissidentatus]